ncbi:MAG: hypothetical protein KDJ65_30845 [Anaerolineae bacterium]|nr:hypothetical protein [Anaerolineae bacterium]
MAKRKKKQKFSPESSLLSEEQIQASNLPSFTSSQDEIRKAVEQNASDRGVLLLEVIVSLEVDKLLALVDEISELQDKEDFFYLADKIGIQINALKSLDNANPPVHYARYFCLPKILIQYPQLIFYYRNIAMLSRKVMRGIGLDTKSFELDVIEPSEEIAHKLATYFNEITSELVLKGGVTPYRHIIMMSANLGDSLGGTSRNEVGRIAMMRVINPLINYLHSQKKLSQVLYSLKGKIVINDDDNETEGAGAAKRKRLNITLDTNIEKILEHFDTYRVLYHEIETTNGNKLLLNRQLKWKTDKGTTVKIGPDLHSFVDENDMFWAAELKGGADPAGSDEHWKTATKVLDRIIEGAKKTNRTTPKLSFIATILVDRVAQEAQNWIDQGKLTSVYNLTQMYEKEEEMERFLKDMDKFLGYDN